MIGLNHIHSTDMERIYSLNIQAAASEQNNPCFRRFTRILCTQKVRNQIGVHFAWQLSRVKCSLSLCTIEWEKTRITIRHENLVKKS